MAYKEKLAHLLSDIQSLEMLVRGMQEEDDLSALSFARAGNWAYAVLEKLKALENEQMQQLHIRLVEQQEELNHLQALTEQYQKKAEERQQVLLQAQKAYEEPVQVEAPAPLPEEEAPQMEEKAEEPVPPVAEKPNVVLQDVLAKQTMTDFRKAFSLNDRFRFRRELFGGDEARMNQTIADLNAMTSLDEAKRYLQERMAWDWQDEATSDFIKLLEKRFI